MERLSAEGSFEDVKLAAVVQNEESALQKNRGFLSKIERLMW